MEFVTHYTRVEKYKKSELVLIILIGLLVAISWFYTLFIYLPSKVI